MYVCGSNVSGNMGTGTMENQHTLTKVDCPPLTCVSTGSTHTIGVAYDGTAWGCGSNSDNKLGDLPQDFPILTMTQIPNFVDIKTIATGINSTVLLGNDGRVTIAGKLFLLLDGSASTAPVILPIPVKIEQITAGMCHCLMLDAQGFVHSYGSNDTNALGYVGYEAKLSLKRIKCLSDIISISSGLNHSLCLDKSGNVYGFGQNGQGQLGVCDDVLIQTPVKIMIEITKIDCGGNYSVFRDSIQNVWVCGDNNYGQLGLNPCLCIKPPQICQNFKDMKIIPGLSHTFLIDPQGEIYSCGANGSYQCGQPIQELKYRSANFAKLPDISFKLIHGTKSATGAFTIIN